MSDALERSDALTALLRRLHESRARLLAIHEPLPEALRGLVRAGPLDDAGWTLLVPSGAAAAKLRQLLPELEAALQRQGWPALPIRIRVQAR
jgi:hypothetical protein